MSKNLPSAISESIIVRVSVNSERVARRWRFLPNGIRANANTLYPALGLVLTLFAIAPLAYPGFFQSYTGYSAVYNLIDLHNRLATFFAWAPTWGRAYDFFRIDGALGYWLAELVHLVGFSFLDSIKIIYALSFVASAFGMFKLTHRVLQNDAAALLAAALYVYFPAHIAAVYLRGNFGEAVAWALFPFALWSAIHFSAREKIVWRDAAYCAAAFAALVLAQTGLAILYALFTLLWLLFSEWRRAKFPTRAALAMLGGLGLGIVLQLPALLPQTRFGAANGFMPAFVYPFQFLSASWGTDLPRSDFMENAPYQIGFAALGLAILAVALVLERRNENLARRRVAFALVASTVLAILMTPSAAPLWDWGLNLFLQYPFQLLAFIGILLPLAAVTLVLADARFQEIPLLTALLIVPLLAVYPYLAPEFTNLAPMKPALARFNNDELALLDAKILRPPGVWRHGATVQLQLTWQALKQPNRDYTVFLHILDENGQPWGATDEKPQGGQGDQEGSPAQSTLQWIPGRVYSDTHAVQIDLNGPPDGYHMELGIYQSTTGERALTELGMDMVRIEELK